MGAAHPREPQERATVGGANGSGAVPVAGARADLSAARAALQDMQENRCFYCGSAMKQDPHVDHFIPWSRYPAIWPRTRACA